jgi:hypothetical protein
MSEFKKKLLSKVNALSTSEISNPTISPKMNVNGTSGLLSQRYTLSEKDPSEYYNGTVGVDAPPSIPVVYGEVLVNGLLTDSGEKRSDIDPDRVIQELVFVVGEGPTDGIPGSTPADQLQNTFINCKPVVDPETGKASIGDVVLKSALAATANAVIPAVLKNVAGTILGAIDPVTDQEIQSIKRAKVPDMALEDLNNVSAGSGGNNYVLWYDAENCMWSPKHINEVLIAANPNAFQQG